MLNRTGESKMENISGIPPTIWVSKPPFWWIVLFYVMYNAEITIVDVKVDLFDETKVSALTRLELWNLRS